MSEPSIPSRVNRDTRLSMYANHSGNIWVNIDHCGGRIASALVAPEELRAMVDNASPGSSPRPVSPSPADGGMASAAVDNESDLTILRNELSIMEDRAEKAERDLSEARQIIEARMGGGAGITVTDEMVERARGRLMDTYDVDLDPAEVHKVLSAALTEPQRPDGAEEREEWLSTLDYLHDETGASRVDLAALANDIAAKEATR